MRYRLHLSAYDVADRVFISAALYDDANEVKGPVSELSDTFLGTGEDDPREWIRDVLVAALETY